MKNHLKIKQNLKHFQRFFIPNNQYCYKDIISDTYLYIVYVIVRIF